jgi:hypothetical protein
MATSGASMRNEPSLSSASATNIAPSPSSAPSPVSARIAPITYPGPKPACRKIVVTMPVVVDLPCVPATAIPRRSSIRLARAAARCSTRRPRRRASASSGLSSRIAVDHQRVGAVDVGCRVADVHVGTLAGKRGEQVTGRGIAARHLHPAGDHDPGDSGHARAADAGEVHPAQFGQRHRVHRFDQAAHPQLTARAPRGCGPGAGSR